MSLQTIFEARPREGVFSNLQSEKAVREAAANAIIWQDKAAVMGIDPSFLDAFPFRFTTLEEFPGAGYGQVREEISLLNSVLFRSGEYLVPDVDAFAIPYASMLAATAARIAYGAQNGQSTYDAPLYEPDERLIEDLEKVYENTSTDDILGDTNNEILIAMAVKDYLGRNGLDYLTISDVVIPSRDKKQLYRFKFDHLVRMIEESIRLAKTDKNSLGLREGTKVIAKRFIAESDLK